MGAPSGENSFVRNPLYNLGVGQPAVDNRKGATLDEYDKLIKGISETYAISETERQKLLEEATAARDAVYESSGGTTGFDMGSFHKIQEKFLSAAKRSEDLGKMYLDAVKRAKERPGSGQTILTRGSVAALGPQGNGTTLITGGTV